MVSKKNPEQTKKPSQDGHATVSRNTNTVSKQKRAEAAEKARQPRKKTKRRRAVRRFFWRFSIAFVTLIFALPLFFLFLYRFEFIHPVSTLMVRDSLIGARAKREWVAFEDMAPVFYQSVMMSEDGRFCSHNGVDWTELNKVIDDAMEGEKTRGASTITMQLVKNLFLWPERSVVRKMLEVPYAMMAEQILSKRRIMEIYLNIVELDTGVFGVEAAAQHYFGRSAAKLGPQYSSLLAVTLPNPKARNPAKPTRNLRRLANTIQKRARASGAYIKCLKTDE